MSKNKWILFNDGPPIKSNCEFYGDRFSVPVIGANKVTGQVFDQLIVYDYNGYGWSYHGLPDGPDCHNYETPHITHYMYLPEI